MFITHDLCVVKHISDEIMVMYMGQVVERAKTEELFENPAHPYTKALLAAIPTIDLSSRKRERFVLSGEVSNPIDPEPDAVLRTAVLMRRKNVKKTTQCGRLQRAIS